MKKILLLLLLVTRAYADDAPISSFHTDLDIPNGCYVKSIAFEDALKSYDGKAAKEAAAALVQNAQRWVRVLIVGFKSSERIKFHAVCVFEYRGETWVYDPNYGTYRLAADLVNLKNPQYLAQKWKPSMEITSASFVDTNAVNIAAASTLP